MFYSHEYKYLSVIYVDLASFKPYCNKLIEFADENVCFCHLNIFDRRDFLLGGRKNYFNAVYEVFSSHF